MAMGIIMKDEVFMILQALALASADNSTTPTPDFLRGYHAALRAVATALGQPLPTPPAASILPPHLQLPRR